MMNVTNMDVRQLSACGVDLKIGDNLIDDKKWTEMKKRKYIASRLNAKKLLAEKIGSKNEASTPAPSTTTAY